MILPDGFSEIKGKHNNPVCLKLNKSIYGLVQATREWNHRFHPEMQNLGFEIKNDNPCLFYKEEKDKFVFSAYMLMI
jgi:hypothetical protein